MDMQGKACFLKSVSGVIVLILPAFGNSAALAQCVLTTSTGNDDYVCSSGTAENLIDLAGDNTLTFPENSDGTITGKVEFGNGDDAIEFAPSGVATIEGLVDQGGGADQILMHSGVISGHVQQNDGEDRFEMSGGTIGSLSQGDDLDIFFMSGGHILGGFDDGDVAEMSGGRIGRVNLKLANNVFDMSGGTIDNNLVAGFQNDTIILSDGTIGGNISVSGGDDIVTITGGSVGGEVRLSSGDDQFTWADGGSVSGAIDFAAGDDTAILTNLSEDLTSGPNAFLGDTGNDEVTITNSIVEDTSRFTGWETIDLRSNSRLGLEGTLTLGDTGTSTGQLLIDETSTLLVSTGNITSFEGGGSASVVNAGKIDLATQVGVGNRLRIGGDYVSRSGHLTLDATLGDDDSASDVLVVDGSTSGTTDVIVNNVGGTGAQTAVGILVVDVGDPDMSTGEFLLANGDYTVALTGEPAIIAGAYGYPLRSVDGDWYLQSTLPSEPEPEPIDPPTVTPEVEPGPEPVDPPTVTPEVEPGPEPVDPPTVTPEVEPGPEPVDPPTVTPEVEPGPEPVDPPRIFQPGAPVYEALPMALMGLNRVGTLAQRIEGRQMLIGSADPDRPYGGWLRVKGGRLDVAPNMSTTGVSFDQSTWRLQAGLDMVVYEGDRGTWMAGINLFTGGSSVDVVSPAGGGDISTDAQGGGLTATYYGNTGFYTDIQMQYNDLESDLSSSLLGGLTSDLDGEGRLASIEVGQEFGLANEMKLVPQAQLTWSEVWFDGFTGPSGEAVSLGSADRLQLRFGVAAEQSWNFGNNEQARVYGIANVTHEMRDETSVLVSGTELAISAPDWVGEIGIGGSYDWTSSEGRRTSLYGEVSGSRSLSGGTMDGVAGTVGLRFKW